MAPLKLIHVPETNTVTRVEAPTDVPFTGGVIPIVVTGEPGAKYMINVDKKTSLTSGVTAEVVTEDGVFDLPNYDFLNEQFTVFRGDAGAGVNALSGKEKELSNGFELDSTGRKTHTLKLGEVSTSRRLDVTLDPITKQGKTSTLSSTAPKKAGAVSIIQRGLNTLTITPTTYDNTSNFGTLPSSITVSKPERFDDDPYRTASQRAYTYTGSTGGVSSTRLILQTDNANVTQGALVSGLGIPHNTTVSSVNPTSLTLSNASIVADGTNVRFENLDANIIPFSFTITPATGKVLSVLDYTALGGTNRPVIVGGVNASTFRRITSTVTASTTVNTITAIGSYSGQGLLSTMSTLPSTTILHGTRDITPGMVVYNADGTRLTTADGTAVTVASVTNHTTLVLSAAVTLTGTFATDGLIFKPRNPDLFSFGLNVDKVGNDIVVSGYLKTTVIKNTGIIPVYLDSLIQAHN
tara:strand:- start:337 stop:1734 length:1398 start_codon:yes stop_codon:yes gene_type:complete